MASSLEATMKHIIAVLLVAGIGTGFVFGLATAFWIMPTPPLVVTYDLREPVIDWSSVRKGDAIAHTAATEEAALTCTMGGSTVMLLPINTWTETPTPRPEQYGPPHRDQYILDGRKH